MADWLSDVRIYAANADEAVVNAIVKYCGIALQSRDGQLVAMSDKKERETVRENYLKKKLGLTQSDADLDAGVLSVGERMKADRTKNRVTVYYLLAEHFGVLNVFGGVAGAAAAGAAALAGLGKDDDDSSSAAPLAAAGLAGAGAAGAAASASASTPTPEPVAAVSPPPASVADTTPAAAYSSYDGDSDSGGGMGWLKWLLLALLLAVLLFFLLRYCSAQDAQPVATTDGAEATATVDGAADDASATAGTDATAAAAAAVPEGAGVVAADREGKPMLTVYFDTGKSDVSNDLTTAAANVKAYLEANPSAKLAVSGFNDPTGNAAINAELSKKRAQGVKAAIEKLGIAADRVELVKPDDTTDVSGDNTAARRVEVTVQ